MEFITGLLTNTSVGVAIVVITTALLLKARLSSLRNNQDHDIDVSVEEFNTSNRHNREREEINS